MLCLVLIKLSPLEWIFGFHNVTLEAVNQGSPTFLKLRATCCVQMNAKIYQFDTPLWNENVAQFIFKLF